MTRRLNSPISSENAKEISNAIARPTRPREGWPKPRAGDGDAPRRPRCQNKRVDGLECGKVPLPIETLQKFTFKVS